MFPPFPGHGAPKPLRMVETVQRRLPPDAQPAVVHGVSRDALELDRPPIPQPYQHSASGGAFRARRREEVGFPGNDSFFWWKEVGGESRRAFSGPAGGHHGGARDYPEEPEEVSSLHPLPLLMAGCAVAGCSPDSVARNAPPHDQIVHPANPF